MNTTKPLTLDLSTIRAVALDLDGVVWREKETLPGTPEFFLFLRERGIPYMMMTNNSTRTVAEYVTRIDALGIPIDGEHILTSGVVTSDELAKRYPPGTPIYVVGSESLIRLLTARGHVFDPENARVVIVGLDRTLTYDKLRIAGQRILAGAEFIGTNGDVTFPLADGVGPGAGSVIAAVQTMTGVTPLIMGKPGPAMFRGALERFKLPADQTLMIGDRLDTDVLGAQRAGMKSALVLTGISQRQDVGPITPDGVYEDLAGVLAAWREAVAAH
jgi:4-nitrophenyl phosphatase